MKFSEMIKEKRLARGLTQQELADALKLTRGYISDIERDIYKPSFNTAIKIGKVLDLDINALKDIV